MPETKTIALPPEVANAIRWFEANRKSGQVQLDFKDGRLQSINVQTRTQVQRPLDNSVKRA